MRVSWWCVILLVGLCISAAFASDPVPFSWSNCGSASDPVQLKSLTISPVPVEFGKNVTVSFDVSISEEINSDVAFTATLDLKKEILGHYTTLPCLGNIGSCTYNNLCSLVLNMTNDTCPTWAQQAGLPCECPVKAAEYKLASTAIQVPMPPANLGWLTDGNYFAEFSMFDSKNNRVLCYSGYISALSPTTPPAMTRPVKDYVSIKLN